MESAKLYKFVNVNDETTGAVNGAAKPDAADTGVNGSLTKSGLIQ